MIFANKVVLITGAGSGIGEATAKYFAKLSANLVLLDKNSETLRKVKDICEQVSNKEVLEIVTDVSKDEEIKRAVDDTIKEYDRVDVLVNCVGILGHAGILSPNLLEVYDRAICTNLRSVVSMAQHFVPLLVKSKGCIVNISSILSEVVTKLAIPYSVSKAGINHFTKCVALELADKGVRANCISPGVTRTNILVNNGLTQMESDALMEKSIEGIPLKRISDPEEVAELVIFLASEKAKGITGANFSIDSGMSLMGIVITEDVAEIVK